MLQQGFITVMAAIVTKLKLLALLHLQAALGGITWA
jgi:hypothetical protein